MLEKKIYVAGHNGMVGSAICRQLKNIPSTGLITRSHTELDLCDQKAVDSFMQTERPDEIIFAAAKVGGIYANSIYPAEFIYQNLQMQNNVIHAANKYDVQKLLFLGSSCIYPKVAPQPMRENYLLTDSLEESNEPYAIAKIAGIKLCESYNRQYGRDYRSVMPSNLYGPGDNYHSENSHVVPALIRRFYYAHKKNAPTVTVWGSGKPRREFMFVDDMAEGSLFVHNLDRKIYEKNTLPTISHINLGTGFDITIRALAEEIRSIIGFQGKLAFDKTKPDGTPRKLMDISLLRKLGYNKKPTSLKDGLAISYNDFLKNRSELRE